MTTAGYIAVALIAAGTATAVNQQQQAAQDQRKTEKKNAALGRARDAFLNAQRTREAIARARVARAQSLALGEAQGVPGSSAVAGAGASVFSDVAAQIGSSQVEQAAAYGINKNNYKLSQDLAKYSSRAQIGQGVASIGSAMLGSGMGFTGPQQPTNGGYGMMQSQRNTQAPQAFSFSQPAQWYNQPQMFGPQYNAR